MLATMLTATGGSPGSRRGRPYGDAIGRLSYDENGNMSGQVMRPDRAKVELGEGNAQQVRAAYLGYIAYFGTYEVAADGQSVVHGGIRFIGSTLWADFDSLTQPGDDLAERLKKRGKAMRAANFYLEKAAATQAGQLFLAAQIRERSLACQAFLRKALAETFDGTTVVVTHFAPSLASADPRYGLRPGTAGFCNALDDLFPLTQFWLHGHLHCAFDYVKDGCRVIANPLGYAAKGEQETFRPQWLIDVA